MEDEHKSYVTRIAEESAREAHRSPMEKGAALTVAAGFLLSDCEGMAPDRATRRRIQDMQMRLWALPDPDERERLIGEANALFAGLSAAPPPDGEGALILSIGEHMGQKADALMEGFLRATAAKWCSEATRLWREILTLGDELRSYRGIWADRFFRADAGSQKVRTDWLEAIGEARLGDEKGWRVLVDRIPAAADEAEGVLVDGERY